MVFSRRNSLFSPRTRTRASVTFRQDYKSDRLSSRSTKTLALVKSEDGRWLIQQDQNTIVAP